ncbi:8-amino-7-oxononanoate synthase [Endozoicomonas sp. OPT23]|uniref:8-amino-7-oxononanoate synthase n=1 Tax=Endozoicomonas sp. OPT23 TaxID=2072845 RepID=UPI00129C0309|nr:8-amino-7-oxononanoate synthase [Endozoicomonas sp. OPT23]MRI32077.1 8-amino-7-oxononanoate synthase [Endozoicomonas sp. OPT23]
MDQALQTSLSERYSQQLYRERLTLDSAQGPEVIIDGKSYLAFCSNDYLGLANHPDVIQSFQKAANQYGLGSGASQLIVGHCRSHCLLEEELAEFTGRERALLFSSGYMANLGAMSALLNRGDAVFQDRLNHASLLDAGRLSGARLQRFRHRDLQHLEACLTSSKGHRKLIATDGVFSMDGDRQELTVLSKLASEQNAWLMLDDAHGFGVLGKNGRGSTNEFQLTQNEIPILMATLGKSAGSFGAFVAGSDALIETLIQFSRSYIYTTALPPAVAEATRTSLRILARDDWRRDHLKRLVSLFREECLNRNIPVSESDTAIQPVIIGDIDKTLKISRLLFEQGILVSAIRPPTVPIGSARLRITFSASHTVSQVERLVDVLSRMPWQSINCAA